MLCSLRSTNNQWEQVADESLPRAWSVHTPGSTAYKRKHEQPPIRDKDNAMPPDKPLKRKRGGPGSEPAENDPKLNEFFEVMQPASKSKTWANEDLSSFGQPSMAVAVPEVVAIAGASETEDEYESISINSQNNKPPQFKAMGETVPGNEDANMEGINNQREETSAGENTENTEESLAPVSDADWLRSKTSRLLDLTDDVNSHLARETISDNTLEPVQKTPVVEQEEWAGIRGEEVNEGANPEEGQKETEMSEEQAAIRTILKTGRLFLRNLSYSITEDDLQQYFLEHGELEEVSFVGLGFCVNDLPQGCFTPNAPFVWVPLIGTSYTSVICDT